MTASETSHAQIQVRSLDGTLINGHHLAGGAGTTLLIANAIGADLSIWDPILPALLSARQLITWDHRGLHRSSPSASGRLDATAHTEDALAVVDALEVDRFVVASWSSGGSRIALQLGHDHPDRVAGLAVVCGGYGRSAGRFVRYAEIGALLPAAARLGERLAPWLGAPWQSLVRRPELAGLIRQSGVVGPTADASALVGLMQALSTCDLKTLLGTYEAVAGDAAPWLLPRIEAETLLVAGERDRFVSLRMMQDMERAIPRARLEVYDGATHYLPIEYPERLANDLAGFFAELD